MKSNVTPIARRMAGVAALVAVFLISTMGGDAGSRARAATPVYVDGAGICNGLVPCFTTVQAGVDNAGPAPATVFIFPGTYSESVDLSAMGSTIAGTPGDIAITTVNASGTPTAGTADISAGTVDAVHTGGGAFPGDITITGLHVRSASDDGFDLETTSSAITLMEVNATGSGDGTDSDDGAELVSVSGDLLVIDSQADGNTDDGIELETGGDAAVVSSTADFNDDDGIEIDPGAATVLIDSVSVDENGDNGIEIQATAGTVLVEDSISGDNADDGIHVNVNVLSGGVNIVGNVVDFNGNEGIDVDGGGPVSIACNEVTDSGDAGIEVDEGDGSTVSANFNNISGNLFGMRNGGTGTMDAENNFWGDPSGPSGEGSGTGDEVGAGVDFTPFLSAPVALEGGACPPGGEPTATPPAATSTPMRTATPGTPSSNGGGSSNTRTPTPTATVTPGAVSTSTPPPPATTATRPAGSIAPAISAPDTGTGSAASGPSVPPVLPVAFAAMIGALALAGGAATLRRG